MKKRYRAFQRSWGTFYCEDLQTKKQESLKTKDKDEAFRLVAAKNETADQPTFSRHLARVYWRAGDPQSARRTWQDVMDEILEHKQGATLDRWIVATKDKAMDSIRNMVVLETEAEDFLRALKAGRVATNHYLKRIQNFALDMNWLPWPIIAQKLWPKYRPAIRRAITSDGRQGTGRPVGFSR